MGRRPSAHPANRRGAPGIPPLDTRFVPKVGFIVARRTGRLRGAPAMGVRRPGTPPRSERPAFRPSPSPEPAEESAARTEQRRVHSDVQKRKKALYLIVQEQGSTGDSVCYYAVHRVDLARCRNGISVTGEELDEPPLTRFNASPGLSFFKMGSKILGVTDKDARGVQAESVVIDAGTWDVSPGPPPTSTTHSLVGVSGKIIYAVDTVTDDPHCEVLRSASAAGWSRLMMPGSPFSDRVVSIASYPPQRGVLVATEKGEAFLLDGRRRRGGATWVALNGPAQLPVGARAVYAEDHDLWFEVSPNDGRLRAHEFDVVNVKGAAGEADLMHASHRVADPVPVVTTSGARCGASTLVYLGSGKFCVAEETVERRGDGSGNITVTVFKVIDSEMPVNLKERTRRRRLRGMNAGWLTAELERTCADKELEPGRRRRRLCRVNLWSQTYVVRGSGAGRLRGPWLAGMLWM